jgi:hypothetical protein
MKMPLSRGYGERSVPEPTPRSRVQPSDVVERLQSALIQRGVPARHARSAIAEVCEITPQTVFHWFNGRTRMPRADYLARLAHHFELDLMWLILGDAGESP